ncbi:uncharacterized protein LOC134009158 [Osmerus eperlanus]|uniref:uncharacterized protein LOC134009158 n=1 Tax=Osmerus eperlanus TaxID=29151 RepID=UPI002E10BB60
MLAATHWLLERLATEAQKDEEQLFQKYTRLREYASDHAHLDSIMQELAAESIHHLSIIDVVIELVLLRLIVFGYRQSCFKGPDCFMLQLYALVEAFLPQDTKGAPGKTYLKKLKNIFLDFLDKILGFPEALYSCQNDLVPKLMHHLGAMFSKLLRVDEDLTEDQDQDSSKEEEDMTVDHDWDKDWDWDQGQDGCPNPDLDEEQDSDDPAGHQHRDAGTQDGYDDREGLEMESAGLEKASGTQSSSSSSYSSTSSSTSRGSMARAPSPEGDHLGPLGKTDPPILRRWFTLKKERTSIKDQQTAAAKGRKRSRIFKTNKVSPLSSERPDLGESSVAGGEEKKKKSIKAFFRGISVALSRAFCLPA